LPGRICPSNLALKSRVTRSQFIFDQFASCPAALLCLSKSMWASKRKRFSRPWNLNRGGRAIPRLRLYHCQPSCIGRTQFRPGTNRKTWLLHLFTARIRAALEKSMVPCTIKGYLYTESALLPGFLSVMVSFESSRWPFLTESLLT